MIRNLKALGLALVAVLAMSAVVASAAQAAEFHSETSKTILAGHQVGVNEFIIRNAEGKQLAKTTCTTATVSGTIEGLTAASARVHPIYGEEKETCTVEPIGKATVHTVGCDYILHTATSAEMALVDITCETGKSITINAALGCTIHVPAQTSLNGVHYENENSGAERSIVVKATVTKIHFTSEGCGFVGIPSEGNTAEYIGTFTAEGFEDIEKEAGSRVGISYE